MPLPVAAIPPAAGAFYAGAAAAGHLMVHAAPFLDFTTLSSATLFYWLCRYVWKNKVPAWAKEDVSFRNLLRSKSPSKIEAGKGVDLSASEKEEMEMSNLGSIVQKLQALVASIQLDDDHPSLLQQHAALLAYIQLAAQVKREEQLEEGEKQGGNDDKVEDSAANDEEKKDDAVGEEWTSRDSLYENARSSAAVSTHPSLYSQYVDFVENPKESPLNATLQRALRLATYAYYEDPEILGGRLENEEDCSLLTQSLAASRPGIAAYYVAVSSVATKQLIVGIRGTSTFEDIVTDCCGRSVPLDDRSYYYDHDRGSKRNKARNFSDPSRIEVEAKKPNEVIHRDNEDVVEIISGDHERIWVEQESTLPTRPTVRGARGTTNQHHHMLHCHEGIFVAAKRLVDSIQEQVEHWVLQRGYQLVIAGHSLGSGVASLAAVLLRSRLPELTHELKTGAGPEMPLSRHMHVYCFAPPPVLDRDTALAASSYCTSIVCNADIIPRCSMENLLICLEVLKGIWKELQKQGWAPDGITTTKAFFQRIAKGEEGDMLMSAPAFRSLMAESMKKVQYDAEVQRLQAQNANKQTDMDRVAVSTQNCDLEELSFAEPSEEDSKTETAEEDNYHPNLYIPGVVLIAYERWQESGAAGANLGTESANECGDNATESVSQQPVSWIVTDGTADVLRFLEMDASSRMFMDHITTSYYAILGQSYNF